MTGYKLFSMKKDGSIGSLFINRKKRLPIGVWLDAEEHPTKGYSFRPGWHITGKPWAPHLSMPGRAWYKVEFLDFYTMKRPESQGGTWYISKKMKIIEKK